MAQPWLWNLLLQLGLVCLLEGLCLEEVPLVVGRGYVSQPAKHQSLDIETDFQPCKWV